MSAIHTALECREEGPGHCPLWDTECVIATAHGHGLAMGFSLHRGQRMGAESQRTA